MGLLARLAQLMRRHRNDRSRSKRLDTNLTRLCRFESMEPRQLLAADPLHVGAVYVEEDSGSDLHGDSFYLTFQGGLPARNSRASRSTAIRTSPV